VKSAGKVPPATNAPLDIVNVPAVPPVGVTFTAAEAAPVPTEFVAVTEQEWLAPLTRPVTVIGLAAALAVRVVPEAVQDAVYDVIAAPPFDAGAMNAITAEALPAVALTDVGAPGTVAEGVGGTVGVLPPPPPPPQAVSKSAKTGYGRATRFMPRC
jgi:hypothetical protein